MDVQNWVDPYSAQLVTRLHTVMRFGAMGHLP